MKDNEVKDKEVRAEEVRAEVKEMGQDNGKVGESGG